MALLLLIVCIAEIEVMVRFGLGVFFFLLLSSLFTVLAPRRPHRMVDQEDKEKQVCSSRF